MAKRGGRRGRPVTGVLLLDKPVGLSSNDALQTVKRLYRAQKAGHTGSLDKAASGLLPICFGEATKFSSFLLDADKSYIVTCQLGVETTTGDALGDVLSSNPVAALGREHIEAALEAFRGHIQQVPPMYSALKHQGKRLYELAYQGIEVERAPRPVSIYSLKLLEHSDQALELSVDCSKGTYIRTLVADIGRKLGCGAHVTRLRRTAAGPFREEEMVTLQRLHDIAAEDAQALDGLLHDVDAVLRDMPAVELTDSVAFYLCQGQPVLVPRAPTDGVLRVYNEHREFLGVGEILDDGRVAPRRLLVQSG